MNVTAEWWKENAIPATPATDGKAITGQYLTHVASVRVVAPSFRENLDCYVYGDVSFNVGDSGDPVTLYSRLRDNPDHISLDDHRDLRSLTLSDDHRSQRPLGAVSAATPLHVKMKLYEKYPLEEKDKWLADAQHWDSCCELDMARSFVVEGDWGFRFEVCYAVIFGARAEVEVMISGGGEGSSMKGQIGVYQYLEAKLAGKAAERYLEALKAPYLAELYESSIPGDGQQVGETITPLVPTYENKTLSLDVGTRIDLNRKFVVVPMTYDRYLSIALVAVPGVDATIEHHEVYFPLGEQSFLTNEKTTHTKFIRLTNGTELSASIKFVYPVLVLEEDGQTRDEHDTRFAPPSSKRSRSSYPYVVFYRSHTPFH